MSTVPMVVVDFEEPQTETVVACLPQRRHDSVAKRALDIVVSGLVLTLALPLIALLAVAIKLESPGPALFRCRRVGWRGRQLEMLKFRKMRHDAAGPALTEVDDPRFTRMGHFLAATKLDELPQLWNVLKGEMSLVGPRPEDPVYVTAESVAFDPILVVRPGATGLSQLAFAREAGILDPHDREADYLGRLLPQKLAIDLLYVSRRSFKMDLRILYWTTVAVILRREVAVHRTTGRLGLRRRPRAASPTGADARTPSLMPNGRD